MAAFMGSHQFPPVEATNKKDGRTEAAVAALRSLSQGGDQVVAGGQPPSPGAAGDAVRRGTFKDATFHPSPPPLFPIKKNNSYFLVFLI